MDSNPRTGKAPRKNTPQEKRTYQIALCESRESPNIKHMSPTWAKLAARLQKVQRTSETFAEYLAMSKDQQADIKDVGAYVAGSFNGFQRRKDKQIDRTLLTLDIDEPGVPWLFLRGAIRGEFCGLCYVAHTTHKHCADQPRLRVVLPLSRPVDDLEYQALCRQIAYDLDPSMVWVDRCSFDFTRLMYWPSVSKDGEFFAWANDGQLLNVDKCLARYDDHTQPDQWPRRDDELVHVGQLEREDPRNKRGVIGTFCRLYDIERVLDELIPGTYDPVDGADDRYTYVGGTTSGGARLYRTDDGFPAFLHSEHDHDPARGQHIAWDLVRLHKGFDSAQMDDFVQQLVDVKAELADQLVSEFDRVPVGADEDAGPDRWGWLRGWVFCSRDDKFFNTTTRGSLVGLRAFNGVFDREAIKTLGADKNGLATVHAADIALQVRPVPVVETTMYWPGESPVFTEAGERYANSYRDLRPEPISRAHSNAVRLMLAHLDNLFPGDGDSQDIILDFVAHLVRYPERRLHYALLIRGAEGDGKTYFAEVLRHLLGTRNWMTIGNDQIKEQYSAWLEGNLIICIEEIKQHGQDAQDTLNRLKPYITNTMVGVRAMRQDMKRTRAFASFFLTTNYLDALPLEDGDSRYCVLSTRFTHKDEVTEWADSWAARNDGISFYTQLYSSLKGDGPGELRAWLDARPFSKHYCPDLRAPNTMAKAMMVQAVRSDADQLLAQMLEEELAPTVTHDFIVVPDFKDMANRLGEPLPSYFTGRAVSLFMTKHGYRSSCRCRTGARSVRVWVRNPSWLDPETLRLTEIAMKKIKKAAIEFKKLNPL